MALSKSRAELKQKWTEANQGHVFQFLDRLTHEEQEQLWEEVEAINVDQVNSIFSEVKRESEIKKEAAIIEPLETVKFSCATEEEKQRWTELGYKALVENKVVILLLAGGQGTRLGSTDPKGMYNVGLPSGKSLFKIQAERIRKIQMLAFEKTGKEVKLDWYIMTSDGDVDQKTRSFFEEHDHFGLSPQQVRIFKQGILPAVTPEGKIILEYKSKIAVSPNGNGEIWRALGNQGILEDWEKRGIQLVWSYIVDNILVKIADPVFLGFSIEKNLDVGAKVVPKLNPEERVGVLALRNKRYTALEYSEIDEEKRYAVTPTGDLVYNASHLVINTFTVNFIRSACKKPLPYHIAKKKIPYIDDNGDPIIPATINGWKFELFAFDIYEYAIKMIAFEVLRSEEFSPLKNSMDLPSDNPETCRNHLSNLHKKWLVNAGGIILNSDSKELLEISPLISYDGEGLEKYVKGKEFTLPYHLS